MGTLGEKIKGIGATIGTGVQTIADEAKRRAQIVSWKNQILDVMYDGTIINLAKERNLRPKNLLGERIPKPSVEDYRQTIILNVRLRELIDYCNKKGVPIRDITEKIDLMDAEKELEEENIDEKVIDVVKFINEFKPSMDYLEELPYQAELIGWLKTKFPEAIIEKQRRSSRPDIAIGGIAIEVKGPTRNNDLDTIPNKCMRYSDNFKQGIIVVLFNLEVNNHMYTEWLNALKKTYPQVIVIKK